MSLYRVVAFLCLSLFSTLGLAQNKNAAYAEEAVRAQALLNKAIVYYKANGDAAMASFSRQGPFVDQQLYIYVVDTSGVMLASGGPSGSMIGKQVTAYLDDDLKAAFQKAIAQPEDGQVHSAEYRWWNWNDGKVERKRVFYQRVGERIFAVGYYLQRANVTQAQALLEKASEAMAADPKATLKKINDPGDKAFIEDDLYVFVVDLKSKRFVGHGFLRRLIGTDFATLKAYDGQPIGEQMLAVMAQRNDGEVDYLWRNPMTGQTEFKRTFLKKAGNYAVAVGVYEGR
ncbi:cache domain-containing protein [Pseudomonas typographi]|uniref:cache domain-containing protein n=1 Tax=Pseudomonas typographi TaxID=2715964 RepID=UPI001683E9AD|nr:cache domain-containing protein [Pseudomonas typographi]MBD1555031.1 calcium channel protein [Pseudomonas typographi]